MTTDAQTQKSFSKPTNEIDLQAMTTMPFISSDYMSDRVRNLFREFSADIDENGKITKINITKDYWALMEIYTQDFRLGNLNKDELEYFNYHMNIASDILTTMPENFNRCALFHIQRAVAIMESSQSKGGFLRRLFNTVIQNLSQKDESEPPRRNFFGLGKKN